MCSCWFECVNPCVCSSVVERCPDKTEALGPIPSTRTWHISHFLFMEDKKDKPKSESLLNSEYLKIFTRVSVWIITPVIFSLIIGKYLDSRLNTEPLILMISLASSFTVSMFAIVRIAKQYMEKDNNNNE